MKKMLFLFCAMFMGVHSFAIAQDSKKMMKDAKKLSYEGQIDHAKELLDGKERGDSKEKPADDGWDMTSMMLAMVWGAIGGGYFIYGKKQSQFIFLICGIVLCVFPMIVTNTTFSIVLGVLMCVIPFKING